jgi:hypothetical protein
MARSPEHTAHVCKPPEITPQDLQDAYVRCGLHKTGIGFEKAITTPCILAGLRGTVLAHRKVKKAPQPQGELFRSAA